jgi:hypothetical protein
MNTILDFITTNVHAIVLVLLLAAVIIWGGINLRTKKL